MKHDTLDKSSICNSLFWVGPAKGRTGEDAMKPDIELVLKMKELDLKVEDLILCHFMMASDEMQKKLDALVTWYKERES